MDAEYLQKNIIGPLSEAMASMAVKTPDDEVNNVEEYVIFIEILHRWNTLAIIF